MTDWLLEKMKLDFNQWMQDCDLKTSKQVSDVFKGELRTTLISQYRNGKKLPYKLRLAMIAVAVKRGKVNYFLKLWGG